MAQLNSNRSSTLTFNNNSSDSTDSDKIIISSSFLSRSTSSTLNLQLSDNQTTKPITQPSQISIQSEPTTSDLIHQQIKLSSRLSVPQTFGKSIMNQSNLSLSSSSNSSSTSSSSSSFSSPSSRSSSSPSFLAISGPQSTNTNSLARKPPIDLPRGTQSVRARASIFENSSLSSPSSGSFNSSLIIPTNSSVKTPSTTPTILNYQNINPTIQNLISLEKFKVQINPTISSNTASSSLRKDYNSSVLQSLNSDNSQDNNRSKLKSLSNNRIISGLGIVRGFSDKIQSLNPTNSASEQIHQSNSNIIILSQSDSLSPVRSSLSLESSVSSSSSSPQPSRTATLANRSFTSNSDQTQPKPFNNPQDSLAFGLTHLSIDSPSIQAECQESDYSTDPQTPTHSTKRTSRIDSVNLSKSHRALDDILLEKEPRLPVNLYNLNQNSSSSPGLFGNAHRSGSFSLNTSSSSSVTINQTTLDNTDSQSSLDDLSALALSAQMTEAGMLIQQVALALFEIQELRHSNSLNQSPAKDTTGLKHSGASSTPRPQATTDQALIKLERKALETSQELIRISQALQNLCSDPTAPGPDFLIEKLENLRSEWLKVERDVETLKEELKEDKWLVVFRTVSSQAEEMMKSLEKACRLVDEFILEVEISECDDDDGGGLKRSTNRQHSLPDQAIKTRRNRTSLGPGVVVTESRRKKISDSLDLDQLTKSFATLQKNFDAKKKHYLPSCERVLGILAKGIESRSTKNGQVLRRYFDMKTRFSSLQDRIATLEHALEEFQNFLPLQTNVDPLATSGLPPNPTTASPLTQPSPISASLTLASRTKKTLSSMTQYLRPASPTSLAKNSAESTLSPFKRLAARISSSTASRPVPRSQTPSVCSTQSVPSLQSGSQALVQAGYKSSQLSQSLSIGLTPPANHLRSVRSTLKLGPSASTSSSSFSSRPPPAPSARVSSALQARSQPSVLKTPTTANSYQSSITNSRMMSRSRLGINKLASSSAPTNPKPRWNISLKPVEDSPTFLNAPVSRIQQTNFRNASHSYSPTARLSSTDSRLNLRSQTPNLTRASMAKHHQLTQQRVPSYDRPGSAAGRSDASVLTMVSIAGYRSRPISRDCRIPGPVWDPTILSRGSLSRSQSRIGNERDSRSSVGPGRVALSPTPSDFDVLRGILRSSSRAESRAGEHCLIPVARYSRKISKQVTEGESGLEVEELKDFERGALEEGVEEITGEVDESKRRQEDPLEAAIALTLNRQSLQSYLKSNTQRFAFKRVELSKSHKLSEVGEMKNEDDGIRYFFGITGIRSNKKLRGVDETKRQIKRLNEDCEISWMKRSVYCKVERKDGEVYVKESEERNWKCLESYLKEDFLT